MLYLWPLLLLSPELETVHIIQFDRISIAHAQQLNGKLVQTTFRIATPPDTRDETTAIGPSEQADGSERVAYLGANYRIDVGDTVTVVGVLRVRRHPAFTVGGVVVPAWVEVRIDGELAGE